MSTPVEQVGEVEPSRGNWFQTASGRAFYPMDPRADEVFISDIAHALANICRFGGHAREFYSVGQHCLLVSFALAPVKEMDQLAAATSGIGKQAYRDLLELGLLGLLHDAAEAYIGDMVSPVKHADELIGYRRVEGKVEKAIGERFQVRSYEFGNGPVKDADRRMLFTEKRDLRGEGNVPPSLKWEDADKYPAYDDLVVRPMPAGAAREGYLERFADLWQRLHGEAWSEL